MNYASLFIQKERVFANQPIHHIAPQYLLAIHPNHSLAAYRSMLELDIVKFSAYRNHPARDQIVLTVIPLERLAMIRNDNLHRALVASQLFTTHWLFVVSTTGRYSFPIETIFVMKYL